MALGGSERAAVVRNVHDGRDDRGGHDGDDAEVARRLP